MPTIDKTVARNVDVAGIRRRVVFLYTGPSSYSSGGDSITPASIGLGVIEHFPPAILRNGTTAVILGTYDYTAQKLVLFSALGTEASGDNSAFSARIEVIGR